MTPDYLHIEVEVRVHPVSVYTACFATALVYTNNYVPCCTVAVAMLLLCLPAAVTFYIVVFQDVMIAVVLELHACVGRDQHLCYLLFPGGRGIGT